MSKCHPVLIGIYYCVTLRHHFVTASSTSCMCCVGLCNGRSQVTGRVGWGVLKQIEATDPIIYGIHTQHSLHNYTEIKNGKRAKISVRQSVCLADRQSAYGWQLRCCSGYRKKLKLAALLIRSKLPRAYPDTGSDWIVAHSYAYFVIGQQNQQFHVFAMIMIVEEHSSKLIHTHTHACAHSCLSLIILFWKW
jgi:hypothetical protein